MYILLKIVILGTHSNVFLPGNGLKLWS